ncbi:uncharacterized protein LOC110265634 [Arachis ipaensis]|uniref:uncharacterized protein LOC110265634 n=1 Tax=Arachis ipaensis TaxID=130454 RepID=UPI000A2B1224|nr:uncharacterized protein LOC110265634 [Arachis ipaensis]
MGRVHAKGNLPFSALVSNLVAAAGVPCDAKDMKATILAKGDIVPSGKYLQPPMDATSLDIAPPPTIPTTSSTPPKSTHQLLVELHEKINRYERRNKRRFAYMKKLWSCVNPPMEEPNISTSDSDNSEASTQSTDEGSGDPNPLCKERNKSKKEREAELRLRRGGKLTASHCHNRPCRQGHRRQASSPSHRRRSSLCCHYSRRGGFKGAGAATVPSRRATRCCHPCVAIVVAEEGTQNREVHEGEKLAASLVAATASASSNGAAVAAVNYGQRRSERPGEGGVSCSAAVEPALLPPLLGVAPVTVTGEKERAVREKQSAREKPAPPLPFWMPHVPLPLLKVSYRNPLLPRKPPLGPLLCWG